MISIIIPTLNEEKYLPFLLESIKNQKFFSSWEQNKDYEIIVADADSEDRTKEIALNYGCRIVKGGLPARGRNQGARIAKGDLLLFLDADAVLSFDFLEKNLAEFEKKELEVAGVLIASSERTRILTNRFFDIFYNLPIILMEKKLAHAATAIFIKKSVFEKINGFAEDIILAEDHDMVRRAAKLAKFGILKSRKIKISERRFRKDGWLRTYFKYLFTEVYMTAKGPIKKQGLVKYQFNHYNKKREES